MMNSRPAIDEISDLIRSNDEICIVMHKSPDGDTLGSSLALYCALLDMGKSARIYCVDPTPAVYGFLPRVSCISDEFKKAPLVITVDCADLSMTGAAGPAIGSGFVTVVIDHHCSNRGYGDVNWIVPHAAASAELVYELIARMGIPITEEIADCLYTGIVTDTGRFSFDYTRPESLRIAAALIDRGAHFTDLCDRIFRRRSLARTRLLGAALGTLAIQEDPRIAVMTVTREMISRCGAAREDTETIINYGIEIDGIEIAALFQQTGEEEYKVSLRSSGRARVDRAAQALGGGGHAKAAGCTLTGAPGDVLLAVLDALREYAYA